MTDRQLIHDYCELQSKTILELKNFSEEIEKILKVLIDARDKKNRIFVMGNGGSASTSSHFVSDLLKTCIIKNEKRFRAISLVDNIPVILAWANDKIYDEIFSEQLKNNIEENDVVIGFSGSGNSQNVINAINFANESGATTIMFTGKDGGKLSQISKISLVVPNDDMLTIETIHLCICNMLTTLIRNKGEPLFSY